VVQFVKSEIATNSSILAASNFYKVMQLCKCLMV